MKTMKKIVAILAVALMLCSILPLSVFAADNVADLNTLATNTSYTTRTTTAGWVATNAATAKSAMTSQNVSVILNGKKTAKGTLTSPTLSDGISELSFGYGYSYSESKGVNATINIKNTAGNVVATDNLVESSITQNTAYTYSWTLPTAVTGDFVIEILNNGPSNSTSNKDRLSIWNVTWVSAASEPSDCEHENAQYEHNCQPTVCPDCEETLPALTGHTYNENVTLAPTCTEAGEKTLTCACGDVKTEAVEALGHNYVDGICSVCGEEKPLEATIEFTDKANRVSYSIDQQVWAQNGITVTNNKASSTSNVGDYGGDGMPARFYKNSEIIISFPEMSKMIINAGTGDNYVWTTTLSNAGLAFTADGNIYTITFPNPTDSITLTAANQVRANSITAYGAGASPCEHDYVGVETQAPSCTVEGVTTYTCSKCGESYTEAIATIPHNYVEDIIDSTCTTTGTKTYECSVCFDSYDEIIPVKPHNYVNDVCADCGAVKAYKGTIDFSTNDQRTEYSTSIQKWENEGLTLINNKASATTNIGDYSNPARFYKSTQIIVSFPEMSKLIIDATGVDADKLWDDTLTNAGLTFTVENKIYTITFAEAENSLELTCANQVRANSITAIVAHECVWTDATCTAPKTCSKCGATEGEALGHTYFDDCSAICDVCGYEREVSHNVVHVEAKTATCTEMGNIEYWYCDVCGMAWLDEACTLNTNQFAVKLPVAEHTYDNDFDADCNDCGAVREVAAFPVSEIGKSISEDVNGYAVLFDANVEGLELVDGAADYTNATYESYKLLGLGVTASNSKSSINIEGERVYGINDETGALQFAFRVINIPADKLDVEITMVPYYIVEIDGVATTIEGEAVVGSYAEIAG